MYHDKIDIKAAQPIAMPRGDETGVASMMLGVIIVLALPVIGLGLLFGAFWRDLKALARAAGICVQTYAAEFARRR